MRDTKATIKLAMSVWIDERIHRLALSVERCSKAAGLFEKAAHKTVNAPAELYFLRKESSICLRRAFALWWGLRWGRK